MTAIFTQPCVNLWTQKTLGKKIHEKITFKSLFFIEIMSQSVRNTMFVSLSQEHSLPTRSRHGKMNTKQFYIFFLCFGWKGEVAYSKVPPRSVYFFPDSSLPASVPQSSKNSCSSTLSVMKIHLARSLIV